MPDRLTLKLSNQALKYLNKQSGKTKLRLDKALLTLSELEGDIRKIGDNQYRFKIHHYRILFSVDKINNTIEIHEINSRTNIKY